MKAELLAIRAGQVPGQRYRRRNTRDDRPPGGRTAAMVATPNPGGFPRETAPVAATASETSGAGMR
jgi:hypothetical protein